MCDALNQEYRIVEKDDYSFCIVNAFPLKDGHVMVLPRRHVLEIPEFSDIEKISMLDMTSRIRSRLIEKYAQGIITLNHGNGLNTQEHFHIHLLPSRVGLRNLVSSYEKIPFKERASEEKLREIRDYINKI